MNGLPDPELLVLHGLRCIGFSSEHRLAGAVGLETVSPVLRDLAELGLVSHTDGVFGGWGLTEAGRTEAAIRLACELDASGGRSVVESQYDAFLQLNPRLLQVCTDWQMLTVSGVPIVNDHRDPVYDDRVVDRLRAIDRASVPILEELAGCLTRFTVYRPRFERAMDRIEAGNIEFFADHLESYHSIWFQLHEDLLATLGIDRFGA